MRNGREAPTRADQPPITQPPITQPPITQPPITQAAVTQPPISWPVAILHADLDAFYASVEQRDDPKLRRRPVAVGGGVVLAASYEARAFGVRGAMGLNDARRCCPGLIVVPPRMAAYVEASRAVFTVFEQTTPNVEPLSIDEAFLDVTGLRRLAPSPVSIAEDLRRRVRTEVGLAITVGIATTKFLAKVASGVGKPDGLCVVPPGGELDFLHPLPAERVWGVGPKTSERLRSRGVFTVGDIARLDVEALVSIVGPGAGRHLHELAHNRDPRRVQARRRRRSIGAQRAIGWGAREPGTQRRRRHTRADLDRVLVELVDRVSRRMRSAQRVGRTVVLRLRFEDYESISRSTTLPEPTDESRLLLGALRRLLVSCEPLVERRGVTLVGIAVTNLGSADAVQLELPFARRDPQAVDRALDAVRDRFGKDALGRLVHLGRSSGFEAPQLPD